MIALVLFAFAYLYMQNIDVRMINIVFCEIISGRKLALTKKYLKNSISYPSLFVNHRYPSTVTKKNCQK